MRETPGATRAVSPAAGARWDRSGGRRTDEPEPGGLACGLAPDDGILAMAVMNVVAFALLLVSVIPVHLAQRIAGNPTGVR